MSFHNSNCPQLAVVEVVGRSDRHGTIPACNSSVHSSAGDKKPS